MVARTRNSESRTTPAYRVRLVDVQQPTASLARATESRTSAGQRFLEGRQQIRRFLQLGEQPSVAAYPLDVQATAPTGFRSPRRPALGRSRALARSREAALHELYALAVVAGLRRLPQGEHVKGLWS